MDCSQEVNTDNLKIMSFYEAHAYTGNTFSPSLKDV